MVERLCLFLVLYGQDVLLHAEEMCSQHFKTSFWARFVILSQDCSCLVGHRLSWWWKRSMKQVQSQDLLPCSKILRTTKLGLNTEKIYEPCPLAR